MSPEKELSIVVCTYNRATSLAETLSCLIRQSAVRDARAEIIVVDNNSTDNTRAVVDTAITQLPELVRYIRENEQGLSFARNRGINEARGKYIAFTDDDCLVAPEWADAIIDTFKKYEAICVFGRIVPQWPPEGVPSWLEQDRRLWGNLALLDYGDERKLIVSPGERFFGANFSVAKDAFGKTGMFNTFLGRKGGDLTSGEDIDLFRRLLELHKTIVYHPAIIVTHKIEAHRLDKKYFVRWNFQTGLSSRQILEEGGRRFLNIPLWCVRSFAGDYLTFLRHLLSGNAKEAFFYKLKVWQGWGVIIGCVKKWQK